MPKRRRNRRNRRGHTKKSQSNVANKENPTSPSCDVMRACFDDDSFGRSKPMSPLELVTPLRNSSTQTNNTEPFQDDLSPIRTTPVNKRRSMTRPERTKYSSMNVTNLNVLFDSNFIRDNSRSASDIGINKSNISFRKRSNSSIPKLHSPVTEKSTSETAAGDTKKLEFEERKDISETPKVSKVLLVDKSKSDEIYVGPLLNNTGLRNDKINNCNRNVKFYNGEVNVNPYLNKEINAFSKDGSFGEISFFSSNLFQHKSSSTPIEKLNQAIVVDYLRDSLRKENVNDSVIGKLDLPNNLEISTAPKLDQSLNLKTPLSEKVLNKKDSVETLKIQSVNLTKRKSYRTSPKSNKVLTQSRIFNKKHSLTYSRLNITRRSSVDSVDSGRHNKGGIGEKLLARLKKYTRVSQNWSVKVMELCTQLGVQLKNSLSSMCNIYNDKSMLKSSEEPICKCAEYREEIVNLNVKIEELTEEVRIVKEQIEIEKSNKEDIEVLNQELNKVREELSQFKELRAELESLRQQLKCLNFTPTVPIAHVPPPPPPPCLPPPPPPPLPPPPLSNPNPLKILKKTKFKSVSDDNSRPVISLDDILKVKLKKTSERSNCITPTSRRLSQPVVSMDVLRQVKLRPASRPSFRPDTPDTGASSASTSPHSSLCRRNLLGKRERDGS